jgi:endonuclease-3 related protein
MFQTPTLELREQLLGVYGIGPETADSILLYAGGHRIFVVDAYTHRILGRHGLAPRKPNDKPEYEAVRSLFESSLPPDARLYNEFHALLVNVGKNWCRSREPRCSECPLKSYLPAGSLPYERGAASLSVLIERPS